MTPEHEQQLLAEIDRLKKENELLRQKLDLVLRKLFGKSAETLDAAQLELLLGEPPGKATASATGDAPAEAVSSAPKPERKPRRERIPDHLPVVEKRSCPSRSRRARKRGGASARKPATASTTNRDAFSSAA